jgi:hypothetical protein
MAQPKVGGFSPGSPIVGSAAGGVCGINHVSRATRKTKCSTLITYNVITRGNNVQNSGGHMQNDSFCTIGVVRKTNPSTEPEGVWVPLVPTDQGLIVDLGGNPGPAHAMDHF